MKKKKISVRVLALSPELNAEVKAEQENYKKMKYNRRIERAKEDQEAADTHRKVIDAIKARHAKNLEKIVKKAVEDRPLAEAI